MKDLLGSIVEVIGYPDPSLIGVKGKVYVETQKTLLLVGIDGRKVTIMKEHALMRKGDRQIYGYELKGRYWERLKRWE
ncbi:MAG: ribonuclease P protein subunit [Thermoprotei archaeon]